MNNSFGLRQIKLRKLVNHSWSSAAAHLLTTGSLPLSPVDYVHIIPSNTPVDLATRFVTASKAGITKGHTSSQIHSESLLLFASCSLITEHTASEISRIVLCLTDKEGAEHIRREAIRLLFLASVLRLKSEEDLPTLVEIGSQALGCNREVVESALLLHLKFVAPWKPLSQLDVEECKHYESQIRWCAIGHSRNSSLFLIALLPWLYYCSRSDEYSVYKTSLLSSPNQFSMVAEAVLSLHEQRIKPHIRLKRRTLEWMEWIRPGCSLSSRITRAKLSSWVQEASINELRLNISYAYRADTDICMHRYLAAARSARPDGLTQRRDGISFITSIFRGAEWIESFLSNLTSLDGFDQCELILINANSPQLEQEIPFIRSVQETHPNIVHLVLDTDPGLYNIWNLGVLLASCPYLSNANLDDRKAKDFITSHLGTLESARSDVSLASAPCIVCDEKYIGYEDYVVKHPPEEHLSFYSSTEYYKYPDFFLDFVDESLARRIVWRNIPHCMPVWRRTLHEKYGFFNEVRGGPTADLEFWLRCAKHGEVYRNLNTPKGLYYYCNKTTYSARKEHTMQRISEHHVLEVETANLAYLNHRVSLSA
jgi:hypothetical protein